MTCPKNGFHRNEQNASNNEIEFMPFVVFFYWCFFVSTFLRAAFRFIENERNQEKKLKSRKKILSKRQRDWMDSRMNNFYKTQAAFFASSSIIHHPPAILLYSFYLARFLFRELFSCLHFPSSLPSAGPYLVDIWVCFVFAYGSSSTPFWGKNCGTFDL